MNSFFRELKQRKVYRVAVGYAVVAWLVVQISATVMPAYHAPEWILRLGFLWRSCSLVGYELCARLSAAYLRGSTRRASPCESRWLTKLKRKSVYRSAMSCSSTLSVTRNC